MVPPHHSLPVISPFFKCPMKIHGFFPLPRGSDFFPKNVVWEVLLYFVERVSVEHYFSA